MHIKKMFCRKNNLVKCDWPTQNFRRKKNLKLEIFNCQQYFVKIFCPWKLIFF
jgi:hypothetical protein